MGIFDKFRKPDPKLSQAQIIARKNSDTAVDYAKSFQKEFDYFPDSIADLEEILEYYSNDISESKPTENQIWSMALIFGSYLGEVMLRNGLSEKGYAWEMDGSSAIPLLGNVDGKYLAPVDKVYKRLVNGGEDNIVSFYDIFMELIMERDW